MWSHNATAHHPMPICTPLLLLLLLMMLLLLLPRMCLLAEVVDNVFQGGAPSLTQRSSARVFDVQQY
jgi:hypothetical protein